MKQTIGLERLYFLGKFKNIKILDSITDIPEELVMDENAQGLLRMLQIIRVDKSHITYREHASKIYNLDTEDALALLDELETDTIVSLQEILKNGELNTKLEKKELEA